MLKPMVLATFRMSGLILRIPKSAVFVYIYIYIYENGAFRFKKQPPKALFWDHFGSQNGPRTGPRLHWADFAAAG